MHMTWNRQKYRTVHNLCMICCVNVNVKYHHPMHLKLPWIHGSPIFTPAVLTSAKFPFLCEFCIILMERPRLNLRSQYWAIWPNLEASSRLGTEIMENSSWEVRPSLPSTRRGRFPGSQRQFFLLLIKMFFWGWTCDKTKRSWTQPSGPLCLWQCFTVSPQKFCS